MRTFGLFFLFAIAAATAFAQHGWPVDPPTSDSPIGNSIGEFQDFSGSRYQHKGNDIVVTPHFNDMGDVDPAAPWILSTMAGEITVLVDGTDNNQQGASVLAADGRTYRFWHLQSGTFDPTFVTNFNDGNDAAEGDHIAKVYDWTSCSFDHCHYDISDGTSWHSPYIDQTPNPDPAPPVIESIGFAVNNSNPWSVLNPVSAGGCTVVTGMVDIIGQIRDVDDAGSAHTGARTAWVRNLRWRACPDSMPGCGWIDTHNYDSMPDSWGYGNATSDVIFSNRAPWDSNTDYCAETWLYGVVTNFSGGNANAASAWNTGAVANGAYTVSIEATDFAGNVTVRNVRACVQNGGGCITDLMIRDATDDAGGVPYPGGVWWVSPDITANPGTAIQDVNIVLGSANPIDVTVRNSGSCTIPSGAEYEVCLGWGPPSGSIAHPLPAAQLIDCQTVTLPAAGWSVGTARTTTFSWTPDAATVPDGHHCLIAWVNLAGSDPVQNTPAVNQDNNRAQQNIEFVAPGPDPSGSFWVMPQRMMKNRAIELTFLGAAGDDREIVLLLPPQLRVERVVGATLDVAKKEDRVEGAICDQCLTPAEAASKGCLRVLRGISATSRVWIEGADVEKPQRVSVLVRGAPRELTMHLIEHAMLAGQQQRGPVGGLTIRFRGN